MCETLQLLIQLYCCVVLCERYVYEYDEYNFQENGKTCLVLGSMSLLIRNFPLRFVPPLLCSVIIMYTSTYAHAFVRQTMYSFAFLNVYFTKSSHFISDQQVTSDSNQILCFLKAVQHERGPRKPKMQHLQSHMQQNNTHMPITVMNSTTSYSHHNAHYQATHTQNYNSILHHPQPVTFAPIQNYSVHATMPQLQHQPLKLDATKLSQFDLSISSNNLFYKSMNHLSVSPTTTQSKSSISVDSPTDGLLSPSTNECCSTPIPNTEAQSTPQNGLLDILMNPPDKYQVFIFYTKKITKSLWLLLKFLILHSRSRNSSNIKCTTLWCFHHLPV